MNNKIETDRLILLPCDKEMLEWALLGNHLLEKHLNIIVPDRWSEFGIEPIKYSLDKLASEDEKGWWTYFTIHKQDRKLIGTGGYKGKPTEEGMVEIGYEISEEYRNKGFATEVTKGLIDNAFRNKQVKTIIAHTLAESNPSVSVLTKCGFTKLQELNDPEDGLIWKWELRRSTLNTGPP